MKSPLNWVGGKSQEADYLATLLPEHSCYVEVFGGGASVLLAKRPSEVEVYNDLNGELVNFFRVVKERPAEFKSMWKWCLVSREEFNQLRNSDPVTLDPLQRAYRFVYLNRAGFGGDMNHKPRFGYRASSQSRLTYWLDELEGWVDALYGRIRNCYVENLDWSDLIVRWDGTKTGARGMVFFCDPPYLETYGYSSGTLSADDHTRLSQALGGLRSRFLLTVNDHPTIRALYDGCYMMERTKRYSISKSASARKEYAELVISNYLPPTSKQATLF